jgi:transcription elongation factor
VTYLLYSALTAGVIFQTERDALKILDQNESVRNLRPTQISSKVGPEAKRAIGLDKDDHEFRVGDQMREYMGEVSSSQAVRRAGMTLTLAVFLRVDVDKYSIFTEDCMSSCTVKTWRRMGVFL